MADFTWGDNGEQISTSQSNSRRRLAEALMAQGTDASPLPTGTRGAGVWTQGLARVAKAISGAMDYEEADKADKAREAKTQALLLGNPALGGSVPAAVAAPIATPAPIASASPDTTGKIYSNDESSPMDPPTGQDRVKMIATILGEENTPQGQAGVANVIRNRAADGGYGGDTPSAVVQSPNQFEPWNTAAGRTRMASAAADPRQAAAADAAISSAYGEGGKAPTDPTEGKTMFYAPAAQAALGRPAPSWAQGPGQMLGKTAFYDDNSDAPAASPGISRVAAALAAQPDASALPAAAQPTQGFAVPGQPAPAAAPAATPQIPAETGTYIKRLLMNPDTRAAGVTLLAQYQKPHETYSQQTDQDGNVWSINNTTGQRTIAKAAEASPSSVREYEYGQTHPGFTEAQLAKTKAGATNVTTNIDPKAGVEYDKLMAEGIGKSHAALSNGVEDAQQRLRNVNAMQGALDTIQKNGGTTGGLGQETILNLKKTLNSGASQLGMGQPFDEASLSDAEMMSKLNRQLAGEQAKNAVGARVTNFDLQNYLAANPGLSLSPTANQRLLGIQAQVENRNVMVGNAIRNATGQAMDAGQKISPTTIQKLIETYDQLHHVRDPVSGQDLTESYALPDLQAPSSNTALAVGHETNIGNIKIKRIQ